MTTLFRRADVACLPRPAARRALGPERISRRSPLPVLAALALTAALPLSFHPALAQSPPTTDATEEPAARAVPPAARTGTSTGVVVTDGEARRRLPATVADASVSIEVRAPDLAGTGRQLAERARRLLDFLRAQGAERLRTESTSFQPEVEEVRGRPDRVKNYLGTTTLSFRTTPDRLPALLSGSLDNGATGLLQSGASPREEEIEAARQELLAEATRAALARARAVAAAAGARPGTVERVAVEPVGSGGPMPPPYVMRAMRAEAPTAAIPVQAGETEISVRVVLTLRLLQDGTGTAR